AVLGAWRVQIFGPMLLVMLLVFGLVLISYRLRGGIELACGCLADFEHKTATSRLILRNLLLLALGLPLLGPVNAPIGERGIAEWLTAILAVVGVLLVWSLASQLIEVVSRLRAERRLGQL